MFEIAAAVGREALAQIEAQRRIPKIVLAKVIKPDNRPAMLLLARLEQEPKNGVLTPLLMLWATVVELVVNTTAYRTVFYATTWRVSRSSNFNSVYSSYLRVDNGNPLEIDEQTREKFPTLLEWARERAPEQNPPATEPKPAPQPKPKPGPNPGPKKSHKRKTPSKGISFSRFYILSIIIITLVTFSFILALEETAAPAAIPTGSSTDGGATTSTSAAPFAATSDGIIENKFILAA